MSIFAGAERSRSCGHGLIGLCAVFGACVSLMTYATRPEATPVTVLPLAPASTASPALSARAGPASSASAMPRPRSTAAAVARRGPGPAVTVSRAEQHPALPGGSPAPRSWGPLATLGLAFAAVSAALAWAVKRDLGRDPDRGPGTPLPSRRAALSAAAAATAVTLRPQVALADIPPGGEVVYPDYIRTPSGVQYKDARAGAGDKIAERGDRVVYTWEGYTIGYFGRPFQRNNGPQGGAFENEEGNNRFVLGRGEVIPALDDDSPSANGMSVFGTMAFGSPVADLYLPYDQGMRPAIEDTVSAVRKLVPDARTILDLGSGPGEPACTLAAALPTAAVICSDVAQAMLDLAEKRAKSEGLGNVSAMVLDITRMTPITSASQDVVTANFAIVTSADEHGVQRLRPGALGEIHRVLKPGGFFVGTVWHTFSVPLLAKAVMAELLGQSPPAPATERACLTDADVLDASFAEAGLSIAEGHNALSDITFDMGPVDGASTWKSVMISALAELEQMEVGGDTTISERAKAAVEKTAAAKGLVKDGRLVLPGTFRALRLMKPK